MFLVFRYYVLFIFSPISHERLIMSDVLFLYSRCVCNSPFNFAFIFCVSHYPEVVNQTGISVSSYLLEHSEYWTKLTKKKKRNSITKTVEAQVIKTSQKRAKINFDGWLTCCLSAIFMLTSAEWNSKYVTARHGLMRMGFSGVSPIFLSV